ncbi:MAG: hypothetical protein M3O70_05085 [Actinomycetota bacterium]|nr:hypothetical protein [Actinomycetota bacterium]
MTAAPYGRRHCVFAEDVQLEVARPVGIVAVDNDPAFVLACLFAEGRDGVDHLFRSLFRDGAVDEGFSMSRISSAVVIAAPPSVGAL